MIRMYKNIIKPGQLDFTNVRTNPVKERINLVTIENMSIPERDNVPAWGNADFDELVDRIVQARKDRRPVIWSMGAHVIKNGLSRYIIEFIKEVSLHMFPAMEPGVYMTLNWHSTGGLQRMFQRLLKTVLLVCGRKQAGG